MYDNYSIYRYNVNIQYLAFLIPNILSKKISFAALKVAKRHLCKGVRIAKGRENISPSLNKESIFFLQLPIRKRDTASDVLFEVGAKRAS
jgi:hypothetical protein